MSNNTIPGQQTFILECSRINSLGAQSEGEDYDNKSSWTNKTAPILLKQGDQVSLQNVLINIGGADTNAIQFQAAATTPQNNIQDNFTLLQTGFYINHNGIYTAALPLTYNTTGEIDDQKLSIDPDQTLPNNRTNNELGLYDNYQYFSGFDPTAPILPETDRISKINEIKSINPFNPMNGGKFTVIHPYYGGWSRPNNDTASNSGTVNNIKLLESEIPILIPQGFTSPTGIADLITNILSYTNQNIRDPIDIVTATANRWKQTTEGEPEKINLKQYSLNGFTYKTIRANLQGKNHRIYGCMAVDEPYQWLYGTQILSNSETDNMILNKRYFNQNNYPDEARVNYPVIVWQRFIGNDPTDFDLGIEGRTGQYSNYSPFKTEITTGGDDELIEVTGLSGTFSEFNDYYINQATTNNDGFWLAQISSTSYQQVKNSVIGTNLDKPALFVDNDEASNTKLIAYRRFNTLKGNWTSDEHQIFKTTNLGEPNVGNSNPYQFSGAGAGQDSENWFSYDNTSNRTIFMGVGEGGLGFTGYVYINNLLTQDSGGIVEGGKYKLTCTLEIQPGYAWSSTRIYFGGNSSTGFPDQSFAVDRDVEIEWEATGDFLGAGALYIAVLYQNIGAVVKVSNISILRENLIQDDTYSVSNVWFNNTTNPEDNKIYSITKNNGLSNLECEVTNNVTNTYFNRKYKVVARGLVANYINGNFVCTSNLTTHNPNVAMLYNDDDPDNTFWMFQTSNPDLWVLYRLEKYQGGIPKNGTILGTIDGAGIPIKTPARSGQQYYDFNTVSNPWEYDTDYIDFELGNTWSRSTGGTYTVTNHIYENLFLSLPTYDFESSSWTGGSGGHSYSFTGESGTTPTGTPYDNKLEDTHGGQIDIYYIQTRSTTGTSGIYEFNGQAGGNNWSYNPNNNSFTLTGAKNKTINNTTTLTISTNNSNYDYVFNEGTTNVYLKVDTTGNYKNGTYKIIFGNVYFSQLFGTWTYDDTTGLITTQYAGNYTPTTNPINEKVKITTNFTSLIAQNLPTIIDGANTYEYFATVSIFSDDGQEITYYIGATDNGNGNDTDKEGQRGRLIWSTDGGTTYQTGSWDWNGSDHMDLSAGYSLYYQGSAPSLTNIVQYETNQIFVVDSESYAVPINGQMYGYNHQFYGSTNTTQSAGINQYLGFDGSTDPDNIQDIRSGFVYNNQNDSFSNNNGKKWKLEQVGDLYKLTLTEASTGIVLITLQAPDSNYLPAGWTLMRTDKILDSQIRDSGTTGNIFSNCDLQGYFTEDHEVLNDGQIGPDTNNDEGILYDIYENGDFSQSSDSGTFKTYLGANLRSFEANIKKSQLLMTNLVLNDYNLDAVKDFFRNTETYNGNEQTRTLISNDIRNFYSVMDLGRSNDDSIDFEETNASQNTTGQKPLVANYMKDQKIMGVDDGDNDNINTGCVCPVFHPSGQDENRVRIFTAWKSNYEERIIAEGMYGDKTGNNTNYCYGNSITTAQFQTKYKNPVTDEDIDTSALYNKCVNENIGIIPFINKQTGNLMIGFEVFEDYDGTLYKIQNLTWFGYSPSVIDHKYVSIFNNDAPAQKNNDYAYTADGRDQMNFLQVGATQPTVQYNQDVNKFTLRYFHTPTFLNKQTGTETNISEEVAKIFDNAPNVIFRDFCYQRSPELLAYNNRINIGINDSQSGIFIKDVFFQKVQKNQYEVNSSNDSLAVKMTKDNFYNSLWFKLGFSHYDLKPHRFKYDSFYGNRFSNLTYNNITSQFRTSGIVPFTTNSLLSINDAPALNIFTQNSDAGTENPNVGTEIYGLGFNNNLQADVKVESDSLFPASIPVNISSGYYRIYTDLPIDTLTYTSDSKLNVIGSALLNYASSQQFFFSYGMDYGSTITKDTLLNNIKISIRDDRGQEVQGLGDRSLVVIKIVRNIQLQNNDVDPEEDQITAPGIGSNDAGTLNLERTAEQVPESYAIPEGITAAERSEIIEKISILDQRSMNWFNTLPASEQSRAVAIQVGQTPTTEQVTQFNKEYEKLPVRQRVKEAVEIVAQLNIPEPAWFQEANELEQIATQERRQLLIGEEGQELEEGTERMATIDKIPSSQELETFINNLNTQIIKANIERVIIQEGEAELDIYTSRDIATQLARLYSDPNFTQELTYVINTIKQFGVEAALSDDRVINFIDNQAEISINVEGKPVRAQEDPRKQVTVSDQVAFQLYNVLQANLGEKEGFIINKLEPQIAEQISDEGIQLKNVRIPGREGKGVKLQQYSNADEYLKEYVGLTYNDMELIKRSTDSETINKLYRNMTKFLLSNDEEGYLRNVGEFTRLIENIVGKKPEYNKRLRDLNAWEKLYVSEYLKEKVKKQRTEESGAEKAEPEKPEPEKPEPEKPEPEKPEPEKARDPNAGPMYDFSESGAKKPEPEKAEPKNI